MATEINCSCEITENEVTICYPPISSGGGGGIGGGGTLNRYAKFTPDGANIGDALIYEDGAGVWGDIGFSGGVGTQLFLGYSASGILTIDGTNWGGLDIGADTVNLQTVTGGINVISRFQINNNDILVKSPNIFDGTYAYFEDDGNGNFTMRSAAPPSGGISSLNALTGATQTFANDTNVTIVSAGTTHTLTWAGTLADARIASAATWNAKESPLTFGSGLTRTVNAVANDLITGAAGGQTIAFGTAATDKGVFKATTGNKTVAETSTYRFLSGNNGAQELLRIGDGPTGNTGELGMHAVGQSSTTNYLLRAGTNFTYLNAGTDLRFNIAGANIAVLNSTTFTISSGKAFKLGNAAVTGLVAGALAALTNASIVIQDSAGTSYRIPCII